MATPSQRDYEHGDATENLGAEKAADEMARVHVYTNGLTLIKAEGQTE